MSTAANDIESRGDEVRDLVTNNDITQALKRMMDFVRDFSADKELRNESIVISADWNELSVKRRRGDVDDSDLMKERRALLFKILGVLDEVVEKLCPRAA